MSSTWTRNSRFGTHYSVKKLARKLVFARPAWGVNERLFLRGVFNELHLLEKVALQFQDAYLACAALVLSEDEVSQVRPLVASAAEDLTAGCELARLGFLKQAYTLWRSWFEQVIFALYFLESPISRIAWKVKDEVAVGDKPSHRLMLHQLITESGEKHPFAFVYQARFDATMSGLKKSGIPNDQKILKRTERIFTTLSQGVHGTFRPKSPENTEECSAALSKQGLKTLAEAVNVVGLYWICFFYEFLSFDERMLTDLRAGSLMATDPYYAAVDDIEIIARLNKPFLRVIGI
ncbi:MULTISPECIES: hypothetical protein [Xanthomonas]|uniref:hypothetical protein n=1 Tax=Xanthomonas TaxID=338 RepID=UPI000ABFB6AE|nr:MULTISPECIES: hypothetical protein [Xanthomonas]